MKTLYLTDLDGTLLRSDESLSAFTVNTIKQLTANGLMFSYATARSLISAGQVTHGLSLENPAIVYNGAFVRDEKNDRVLCGNFFLPEEAAAVREVLQKHHISPIVYAFVDGRERFTVHMGKASPVMNVFLKTRNDRRRREVTDDAALFGGKTFYYTCVGGPEQLDGAFQIFKEDSRFTTIYGRDTYMDAMLLEIMPKKATKANAALQLKEHLGADRLIVFGDGKNDLSMFQVADEAYAMENAVPELKAAATAVIGSNDRDGVARFLLENS